MAFRRAKFQALVRTNALQNEVQSIAELVKFNAEHNPSHTFCLQDDSRDGSLRRVTYGELNTAVNNCIHGLLKQVPGVRAAEITGSGTLSKAAPVALMLESGIGFYVHMVALLSLGVPVVILSARLSITSIKHLLEQTDAKTIITSNRLWRNVSIQGCNVHLVDPLAIGTDNQSTPFLLPPVLENDCNAVVFHSSGTTGLPKAIRHPQRYLLAYAACHEFGPEEQVAQVNVSTLPLYHGFGMLGPALSLSVGMPVCFPCPFKIPTAEYAVELLERSSARSLMTVPSILEDMCQNGEDSLVPKIRDLRFVAVGGGPMKARVTEKLASKAVRLLNHFGATELGPLASIFSLEKVTDYDCKYLRIRKDLGLNLVQLESSASSGEPYYQLGATPVGQNEYWSLKDLIQLREGHDRDIKILSRNDDIIVLSNGEKVMPQKLESVISEVQGVKAALAFGSGRFEIGVLIEPTDDASMEVLRNMVWVKIQQVNQESDSHAQVLGPDAIIIISDSRKFPRADKGSLMRAEAYRLFNDEIEAFYNHSNPASTPGPKIAPADSIDPDNLEESLRKLIEPFVTSTDRMEPSDDFFELGLDSLRAARIQRLISANMLRLLPGIEAQLSGFVYRNTTIDEMVKSIKSLLSWKLENPLQRSSASEELYDLALQYRLSLPESEQRHVVLLTGSTGSIGAHLLAELLVREDVVEVICIDRPKNSVNSMDRHMAAFEKYGLKIPIPGSNDWCKLTHLFTDTKKAKLDFHDSAYSVLVSRVTHIIHNAWPMDFNRSVNSFRGQFKALRNLLRLSLDASLHQRRVIRFVFHSSISVLAHHAEVSSGTGKALEFPIDDPRTLSQLGYARAKWVCEKIVEDAAKKLPDHLDASVIRIGQVCGSTHSGIWSEKEHVPVLLKMIKKSGTLPPIDGTLSWLPVDIVARTIRDIVMKKGPNHFIYHVENPCRQNWSDILPAFEQLMQIPCEANTFSTFEEWLDQFGETGDAGMTHDITDLIPFFCSEFTRLGQGSVILDTKHASESSLALNSFGPVTLQILDQYVQYWKSIGFL